MEIIIQSTSKIVTLNGIEARVWEGTTKSGIPVQCFITRIAVARDEPRIEEFESELLEQRVPSVKAQSFPDNLVL